MRCLLSQLTRRRSGAHARKDSVLVADTLRIGRHASSEIYLADARVLLTHACIHQRSDGFYIESQGGADLRVNGVSLASARLKTGDRIDLGPYELIMLAPESGHDLALSCELSRPPDNDLEALQARSVTTLGAAGLSRRSTSWLAFAMVIAAFLLAPLMYSYSAPVARWLDEQGIMPALAWNSGPISSAHALFGNDCRACHRDAFARVGDGTCARCHPSTSRHADGGVYAMAGLAPPDCVVCHQEHNGRNGLVREKEPTCITCHADLRERLRGRDVRNASDFGWHHPEFGQSAAAPASNLKFPHARHLRADSPAALSEQCQSCHAPEQQGPGMQPVVMARHCQHCHGLMADPMHPEQVLPHAAPEVVLSALIEQWRESNAPAAVQKALEAASAGPLDKTNDGWVKLAESVFEGPLCSRCHQVKRDDTKRPPKWSVAPVSFSVKWWPGTRFSHRLHRGAACTDCHEGAVGSDRSDDRLLPKIAHCRTCHDGEQPAKGHLETFCVDCHFYHGATDMRIKGQG